MKIVRFEHRQNQYYGTLQNDCVRPLQGKFDTQAQFGEEIPLDQVQILAPAFPSKIVCVGLNYHDHILEMKLSQPSEPLLFLKAPSALNAPEASIVLPSFSQQVEFEGELAIVIGRVAKNLTEEEALSAVMGYTCMNDVTARDLQRKDSQFARSKSFDTFACLGPWIETDLDPNHLSIQTRLNGELKQNSSTHHMIFPPAKLVSFISQMMTLYPGDIISTGSPGGTCPMRSGDVVEVAIEGIGTLKNPIA